MIPFDYEYVLYSHSGLCEWNLKQGDPENLTPDSPVVYAYGLDPEYPQIATFTINAANEVFMSINGHQMIISVELQQMPWLYYNPDFKYKQIKGLALEGIKNPEGAVVTLKKILSLIP